MQSDEPLHGAGGGVSSSSSLGDGARGISSSSVREDRGGFQFEFEFGSGRNCILWCSRKGGTTSTLMNGFFRPTPDGSRQVV